MSAAESTVAILFADICGSTALFEETGDQIALSMVADCLDTLAELARRGGGDVIRSKGDDLLCTFPTAGAAFDSASQMLQQDFGNNLDIHAGLHYGPIIQARGDIFGDAVNVAARMLSLANPGEMVVTEDARATLPLIDQRSLRLLEKRAVRGRSEPIEIYTLTQVDGAATQFYAATGRMTVRADSLHAPADPDFRLLLELRGQCIVCREVDGGITMGRSSSCDLVINEPFVSREHASIRVHQSRAVLTDRSSTGTFIMTEGERPVLVRRESLPLLGRGVLSLGREPSADSSNLIRYSQDSVKST